MTDVGYDKTGPVIATAADMDTASELCPQDRLIKTERVWQSNFRLLASWYKRHGHYCIPVNRRDLTSLRLWVATQRLLKQQEKLSIERTQQLQSISFIWDAQEAERNYTEERSQQQRESEQVEMAIHDKDEDPTIQRHQGSIDTQPEEMVADTETWAEASNHSGTSNGVILGIAPVPKMNEWLSIWEKIKQDEHETYAEQPPCEISTQAHGDLSVITMEVDTSISPKYRQLSSSDTIDSLPENTQETITLQADLAESLLPVRTTICSKWMSNYFQLLKFYKLYGHCVLPLTEEYVSLRIWLEEQGAAYSSPKECIPVHRRRLLERINFAGAMIPKESQAKRNLIENTEPIHQFQKHQVGCDENKKTPLTERISVLERWKVHNRKLVNHYKNLLKYYRAQDRFSFEPVFASIDLDASGSQGIMSHKMFRDVTLTQRIQNRSLPSYPTKADYLNKKKSSTPVRDERAEPHI